MVGLEGIARDVGRAAVNGRAAGLGIDADSAAEGSEADGAGTGRSGQ